MQSKLEDVLREKERELKLYQKFVSLKRFCEEEIFPFAPVPLENHIAKLTGFVEKLIPEPRDRTQEMFSGELFVLLGILYFHDIGVVSRYGWAANEEILNRIDRSPKTFLLNTELGSRLDIPEKALELINALIFSVRKIPIEWEIREDTKKAIVRNAHVLGEIFNFAHLMWDIFSPDSGYTALRRDQKPELRLRLGRANVTIDSKEGLIYVKCQPRVPYQVHLLERIREYVEGHFRRFKESVNGRLGFQYREIVWDIADMFDQPLDAIPPTLFPFNINETLPFVRWTETSQLLDKLFKYGDVMMVGDLNTGKSTMINSFVVPQLRHISPHVFYTEVWEKPVREIKEAIDRVAGTAVAEGTVDIISVCNKLLQEAPCFFVLDGCERMKTVTQDEQEKFQRFVDFCIENENVYLLAVGDKKEFFEWYASFRAISLGAIFELTPLDRISSTQSDQDTEMVPVERLREQVEEISRNAPCERELREVVSALTGNGEKTLKRYGAATISFETCLPLERITACLELLREKGIVREQKVFGGAFYALSSRHLLEHIHKLLNLDEFREKGRIRDALRTAREGGEFLGSLLLDVIERWKDRMTFTKAEMGVILASLLYHNRDWDVFLQKADKETHGFDYEYALPCLLQGDLKKRERTIQLLSYAKDEGAANHLLTHLKNETDPALRALVVQSLITGGKRKTVIAVMNVLGEVGDRDARIAAIDYLYRLPERSARELLIETAEIEKDPEVIDRIDGLLAAIEGR